MWREILSNRFGLRSNIGGKLREKPKIIKIGRISSYFINKTTPMGKAPENESRRGSQARRKRHMKAIRQHNVFFINHRYFYDTAAIDSRKRSRDVASRDSIEGAMTEDHPEESRAPTVNSSGIPR